MTPRIVSQSAQDHFETRAAPAYSTFVRLKSRENAIAAAVAFWEMRDHLRKGPNSISKLLFAAPEFKMIRDIAEASKHAELNRADVIVAGISGTGSLSGEATVISHLGPLTGTQPCTLQIDLKDGTSYMLEKALAVVAKLLRADIG